MQKLWTIIYGKLDLDSGISRKMLIDRLLLAQIALAGTARAVLVSPQWLQSYLNMYSTPVPHQIKISSKKAY